MKKQHVKLSETDKKYLQEKLRGVRWFKKTGQIFKIKKINTVSSNIFFRKSPQRNRGFFEKKYLVCYAPYFKYSKIVVQIE